MLTMLSKNKKNRKSAYEVGVIAVIQLNKKKLNVLVATALITAAVSIPAGININSLTINGTGVPSTNYKVTGAILTILNVTPTDLIQVTTSDGTVYTITNGSSTNTTTTTAITISAINNISAAVNKGDSYSLPSTVQATMSDGSTENVAVTWDKQVDTSQVGTYTFNGTVSGYSGSIKLTLIVKDITNTANAFNIKYTWSTDTPNRGYIKINSDLSCELVCYGYNQVVDKKFNISVEQKNTLYKLMVNNQLDTREWKTLKDIPVGAGSTYLSGVLNGNEFNIPAYLDQNGSEIVSPVYKFINDLIQANLNN